MFVLVIFFHVRQKFASMSTRIVGVPEVSSKLTPPRLPAFNTNIRLGCKYMPQAKIVLLILPLEHIRSLRVYRAQTLEVLQAIGLGVSI